MVFIFIYRCYSYRYFSVLHNIINRSIYTPNNIITTITSAIPREKLITIISFLTSQATHKKIIFPYPVKLSHTPNENQYYNKT